MKKIKKWLCAALVSVCTLAAVAGITSEAGHTAKYASVSPDGDIILTTYDHRKTTDVHYRTIGWTVTRCVLGTKTPIDDQYFTIRINNATDGGEDEWMTTTFTIPEAEVMARIAAVDGSWLSDVQGDSDRIRDSSQTLQNQGGKHSTQKLSLFCMEMLFIRAFSVLEV